MTHHEVHETPTVELVEITPELAREWLEYNTHNRNIRTRVVKAYAEDMRAGLRDLNGETIKRGADGTIYDGQHRLLGCIEADRPFMSYVVSGLSSVKVQETVDANISRGLADVLKLRGEANYIPLAATIRTIALWESGNRSLSGGSSFSRKHLLAVLDRNPGIRTGMSTAQAVSNHLGMPKGIAGLTWWLFQQLDHEDAEFFFTRLDSDEGHFAGEPIFELRRYLLNNRAAKFGEKRGQAYTLAVTIKAWNAFREGRTVKLLVFRPGGANPEQFPEPK